MKLIVGLGNPGKQYVHTKHNIGFTALDSYAEANKIKYKKSIKFTAEIAKTEQAIYLKPKTYMNNSGLAVKKVMEYYHIEAKDMLVIFDDLNLPFNKLRLRPSGSAGGHNGVYYCSSWHRRIQAFEGRHRSKSDPRHERRCTQSFFQV